MRAARRTGLDPLTLWWSAVAAALLVVLLLTSCAMSPDQQQRAIAAVDGMLRSGAITLEQHAALLAALTGGDWWAPALTIVGAIIGSWLGVPAVANITRGKIGARKGLAEALATLDHSGGTTKMVSRVGAAADAVADAVAAGVPVTTPEPLRPVSTGGG